MMPNKLLVKNWTEEIIIETYSNFGCVANTACSWGRRGTDELFYGYWGHVTEGSSNFHYHIILSQCIVQVVTLW